jgi:hypothetical protein
VDVLRTKRDLYFRSQMSGFENQVSENVRCSKPTCYSRPTKKRPHCWGHSSKEAKGRKCQERRCKGPIRQPDRLIVRSRERRVKVKRGLFSYLGEKHLPGQNADSHTRRAARRVSHCKYDSYEGPLIFSLVSRKAIVQGKKMHIPAHWLQDATPDPGKPKEIRPGRVYELPATVRSLPGRK